ncbi:MAG: hypothetical protein Q7R43_00460 [Candidatus Daviesbacteria bacterium]|nr:hypothetical protein [Candidatus Daviesbacteria bacterium]
MRQEIRIVAIILLIASPFIVAFIVVFSQKQAVQLLFQQATLQANVPCPVSQDLCAQAKPIIYKGQNLGFGFSLPSGTKITTVFSGNLEKGQENKDIIVKPHPVILLQGKDLTARYDFFGVPTASQSTQDSTIASASAESFPTTEPFKGINFIFSILKDGKPINFRFK